jgi:hypothetical protein
MSELEVILEYKGEIDFETIDPLLERLKKLPEYQETKLPVRKRIYCIFVECIENNYNHSIKDSLYVSDKTMVSYIMLGKQDDHYIISTGNVIMNKSIKKLRSRLEQINQLDKAGIKKSYAEIINKESISEEEGAGLGLITIARRAENKINYKFTSLKDQYSFFEMKISI